MILEKFKPSIDDDWTWHRAELGDIEIILKYFENYVDNAELTGLITYSSNAFRKNIATAIVAQMYDPLSSQVIIAKDKSTNVPYAWAWIGRNIYTSFSNEELADAKYAHVRMDLPVRQKITLIAQMLQQWELWARCGSIPVINSSTFLSNQKAFLKLHEQAGYSVRGSVAYKRLAS